MSGNSDPDGMVVRLRKNILKDERPTSNIEPRLGVDEIAPAATGASTAGRSASL